VNRPPPPGKPPGGDPYLAPPGGAYLEPPGEPYRTGGLEAPPPLTKAELGIRSARFRKGREESWARLEGILARLDKKGITALSAQDALDLPGLYQSAVSSLSLARNLILDRRLLLYLENLSFRGYIAAYGPRETLGEVFRRFVSRDFPKAVRALRLHMLAAAALLAAGFLSGYILVGADLNNFYKIIPRDSAPVQTTDSREEILKEEIFPPWPGFEDTFLVFANFLFRHNTKVAILAFCLSFALGVPTAALVFHNGRILGAVVSLHAQKGLTLDYLAWLSIHGVTELLAIILAAAAGFSIALAIALPGPLPRREAVARAGARAGAVMLGAAMMFFVAAILEGVFRQLVAFTAGRAAFALFTALFWYWYFAFRGREEG
jgi:uncharacterized membrane protein SpoIIM required for sporulation